MILSTPTACRFLHSAGAMKLAVTQMFCWKYSLGSFGSRWSSVKPSSPTLPPKMRFAMKSVRGISSAIQPIPDSASTNFSFGWRSNTPPKINAQNARCA